MGVTPRPLDGVRVLDLSRVISGPHCTKMLADLGADVVKLEPPEGDQTRKGRGLGNLSSTGFSQLNAGKRFISVDLDHEQGPGLVRELLATADVLVENFRPGVLAKWKLDHTSLRERHPRLIYVSISGYGQVGDWRTRRAYAPYVHAEAGYLHTVAALRCSEPDDDPNDHLQQDPMSVADLAAGKDAAIAVLAALLQRARTGQGTHLDISLAHSLLYFNEFASALLTPGQPRPRSGSTPQTFFLTADGTGFSAGNPVSRHVFPQLCRAFGCPELIDDERFGDSMARRARREELVAELQRALERCGDIDSVERALAAEGLVVGRLRTVAEARETDWALRRGATETVRNERGDEVTVPSSPLSSVARPPEERAVAAVGADNEAVLTDLLGVTAEQVAQMRSDGPLCAEQAPAGVQGAAT